MFKTIKFLILFLLPSLLFSNDVYKTIQTEKSLPRIYIYCNEKSNFKNKVDCSIAFQNDWHPTVLTSTIKCRGGSSSKFNKHSYRIELENEYALQSLPLEDDWILNANYIDKTFMRHKLSYDLFRLMNAENISAVCKYVNLDINRKDKGIYVLMQKINANRCGLDKGDDEACLFKDPPVFCKDKLEGKTDNYYNQKIPKYSKRDMSYYLEEFRELLFNSTDQEFTKEISNWIDIDNIIDWHILLLLTNNSDGMLKNFYLYKSDSKSKFKIAIWDYDHSFGRDGDNEYNMLSYNVDCNKIILLKRLLEIEATGYSEKLSHRWFELRDLGIITKEQIFRMIVENHRELYNNLESNFSIWPANSKFYFDDNDYYKEVSIMVHYVRLRIPQLDNYFENLERKQTEHIENFQ